MSVKAYMVDDLRFIGTYEQWERFYAANGWLGFSFGFATDEERAIWRKNGGHWFVKPVENLEGDVSQVDTDGDVVQAEASACERCVSIYRNPNDDRVETLAKLSPDAAEALGRQIIRMAKVARARAAGMDAEDAIDETQWEAP